MLGLLRRQVAVTIDGVDAFAAWAAGDAAAAQAARRRAPRRRGEAELLNALRAAFVTPLEPEDVFALSRGIDWILDYVARPGQRGGGDGVRARRADRRDGAATGRGDSSHRRGDRPARGRTETVPPTAADGAIAAERRLERRLLRGMAALLEVDDMRERISRRELYRRCSRIGEVVIDVAERIVYAVVKQS